jgi:two-component sensor histidine kinase
MSEPCPDEQALLHELNHRINNEFASAIGAVSLAAARSSSDLVKVALTGVAELLHHYAAVHHALQMPAAEALIDAAAYLRKLCRSISRSKLAHLKINFVLAAEPLKLQSHKCWRLGMIVHELITNAARHAFAGRNGEIRVELSRAGALVECRVLDNGSALGNVRPGRGLKIIDELTKGLGGRFEQRFGSQGSISIIVFPCDNGKQTSARRRPQGEIARRRRLSTRLTGEERGDRASDELMRSAGARDGAALTRAT